MGDPGATGDVPRILAIIGSGETTSSMAPLHRGLLAQIGGGRVPAALIDTPYGFQENADDITSAAVEYFDQRVRNPISVASFRRSDSNVVEPQAALACVRDARYVFSGPGSPSYALRQWAGTEIPGLLADKLIHGGALVMASAAAVTLGRLAVPVYEIYKVGEDPRWLPGLDLLSRFGLPVSLLPHYDNAEGRGHDTRYCWLGERRLRILEAQMPDDEFILGIDEHTALVLDFATEQASVRGRRGVTVRRRGRSTAFSAGSDVSFDDLRRAAFAHDDVPSAVSGPRVPRAAHRADVSADDGLRSRVVDAEAAFRRAIDRDDLPAAIRTVVQLDDTVAEAGASGRNAAGAQTDARLSLRSMMVRLADAAERARTTSILAARLTDALVDVRRTARRDRDWAGADAIRDRLAALGVELHDTSEGTTWSMHAGRRRND